MRIIILCYIIEVFLNVSKSKKYKAEMIAHFLAITINNIHKFKN
jgi:hypothetical protein